MLIRANFVKALDKSKQYGIVNRMGKQHIRNYHREVSGGLTTWEVFKWRFRKSYEMLPGEWPNIFEP